MVADKEEYLKVFDENGNDLNKLELRSVVHEKRLFHNEVALWIIDKENKQVLLERRSPTKKLYPNKLALCAGHVVENETILDALYKEAEEELGLNLNNYKVSELMTVKRIEPENCCFSHHFYILNKIPLNQMKIQIEELTEVIYMDYSKLKELVESGSEEISLKWNDANKSLFEKLDKIIGI